MYPTNALMKNTQRKITSVSGSDQAKPALDICKDEKS